MAFLFCFVGTKCPPLFFSFFGLESFCLQLFCFCSALDLLHWRFFQFFRAFQEKTHVTGHSLFTWWSLPPFKSNSLQLPLDLCILCISDSSFKMSVEKQHILGEEGKRSAACAIMVVVVCLRHYYWFLPTIWGWAGAFRHPWKNVRQSAGIEYPGTKGTRDL